MKNLTLLVKNTLLLCFLFAGIRDTKAQCTASGQPNIGVEATAITSVTIVQGATTTVTSPVSGTSYQWILDGVPITGATSMTLTITDFKDTDVGEYTVSVDGVTLVNSVTLNILNTSITDYDRDRLALIDLYNSTNGASWTNNTNWLTGDISTWEGVTVKNCRVTRLSLSNNNLSGSLPSSLSNLTALERLSLRENDISGILDVSTMPSLTTIAANNTQLTDVVFGAISSLQRIYIQNNPFTAGKVVDLSGMRQLIDFRASNANLDDVVLTGDYPSLRYLIMADNNISGTLDISRMPRLVICYAHNNQYSDFNIGIHPELSRFYFYNNPITPGKTMDISAMRNLLDFRVHGLGLQNLIISGTYDKMLYFLIQDNHLTGTLDISKMPNINLCYAHNNQFTDFNFGSHPELSRLYFYNNPIVAGRTMDISSMRNLLDFRVHGLGLSNLIVSGTYDKMLYFLIQDNQISGTLDISTMPNINLCYAHNNQFTDFNFGSHPELGRFYFYNNPLAAGKVMDVSSMRKLLDFRVQGLDLEGLILSGTYDNMHYFLIQDNNLSGTLDLSNMPILKVAYAHNNNYTDVSLPSSVFGADRELGNLRLDNNNLHFDDLIPYASLFGSFNFRYSPQKDVSTQVSGNILTVNVGGGVDYNWSPTGPNTASITATASGTYSCEISNPAVPGLVIDSTPVDVVVISEAEMKSSKTKRNVESESIKLHANPIPNGTPIILSTFFTDEKEIEVNIHSIQGKELKHFRKDVRKGNAELELDANGLAAGMYVLTYKIGGKIQTTKLIIE